MDLHHAHATKRNRPEAAGGKGKQIEEKAVGDLIDAVKRGKPAGQEAEVEAPRHKCRESGVKSEREREQAPGEAREQENDGGVRADSERAKGLRQSGEARDPGIAQQV